MSEETEGWGWYLGRTTLRIVLRMGMNYVQPGSAAVWDFTEAATDLINGNIVGGAINIVSGVSEIVTLGIASEVKEAVWGGAKKGVVDAAKNEAKSTVKKELSKTAAKEVRKQVGNKYGKEMAKGVISMATDEVMFRGGSLLTVKKMAGLATTEVFSNGLRLDKDLVRSYLESVSAKTAEDLFTGFTKASYKNMCPTILNAAQIGAEKEFKKHGWKFFANDVGFGIFKGVIKESGREIPISFEQENNLFSLPNFPKKWNN